MSQKHNQLALIKFRRRAVFPVVAGVAMVAAASGWMNLLEVHRTKMESRDSLIFLAYHRPPPPPQPKPKPVLPVYGSATLLVRSPGLQISDFSAATAGGKAEVIDITFVPDVKEKRTSRQGDVSIVLLMDSSASLEGGDTTDPSRLRYGAAEKLVGAIGGAARLAVGSFGQQQLPNISIGAFTTDAEESLREVEALRNLTLGDTPLYDAIDRALDDLKDEKGQRHLVCFTDGGDTSSHTPPLNLIQKARDAGIHIHFVALGNGDNPVAHDLCQQTGGSVYPVKEDSALADAFQKVSKTLVQRTDNSHYVIKLKVTPDRADGPKMFDVRVAGGGKSFSTRLATGGGK